MNSEYRFTLPWPPSVNGYWRSYKGKQIISKRGREYVKSVDNAMFELGLRGELLSQKLNVSIELNPSTERKYDIDNFTKGVFDSLTKCGFWLDDDQVVNLTIKKGVKTPPGNVVVEVSFHN